MVKQAPIEEMKSPFKKSKFKFITDSKPSRFADKKVQESSPYSKTIENISGATQPLKMKPNMSFGGEDSSFKK